MGARSDGCRDRFAVMGHGLCGVAGHDQACADAPGRTNRSDDVGGRPCADPLGPRDAFHAWPSVAGRASGERVLPADTGLVAEPDPYGLGPDSLRDLRQTVGEVFLKNGGRIGGLGMMARASRELAVADRPQDPAQGLLRDRHASGSNTRRQNHEPDSDATPREPRSTWLGIRGSRRRRARRRGVRLTRAAGCPS